MVDLAIHKVLNRSRNWAGGNTIENNATSIVGIAYTAGQTVTLTLPGARAERIFKAQGSTITQPGVSQTRWDNKDATTTIYDYKKRLWTWRIIGNYATTSFTGSHNFYTDARLLIDDAGSLMLTMQDREVKVFPSEGQFIWEGGMLQVVNYTMDFVEGFERPT